MAKKMTKEETTEFVRSLKRIENQHDPVAVDSAVKTIKVAMMKLGYDQDWTYAMARELHDWLSAY